LTSTIEKKKTVVGARDGGWQSSRARVGRYEIYAWHRFGGVVDRQNQCCTVLLLSQLFRSIVCHSFFVLVSFTAPVGLAYDFTIPPKAGGEETSFVDCVDILNSTYDVFGD
jgi:hypothetical protein